MQKLILCKCRERLIVPKDIVCKICDSNNKQICYFLGRYFRFIGNHGIADILFRSVTGCYTSKYKKVQNEDQRTEDQETGISI